MCESVCVLFAFLVIICLVVVCFQCCFCLAVVVCFGVVAVLLVLCVALIGFGFVSVSFSIC